MGSTLPLCGGAPPPGSGPQGRGATCNPAALAALLSWLCCWSHKPWSESVLCALGSFLCPSPVLMASGDLNNLDSPPLATTPSLLLPLLMLFPPCAAWGSLKKSAMSWMLKRCSASPHQTGGLGHAGKPAALQASGSACRQEWCQDNLLGAPLSWLCCWLSLPGALVWHAAVLRPQQPLW
eukprot:CAMPEP_0202383488 /NCGR_PEP_ID=MMETSP1127-20130417/49558_1 /ASSEMBLY_ACC=CAM_ASM_000462 /TAXON_ID=3047 /ORGANISM="Dunaliella tertiolecta, Strain CCMP1320" /LENGTH=179 /DNA_ID=CAMNT_0048982999 /DNA_START=292 /DNA_END=829 /DNA_ORIENTATION=-